MTFDMKKDEGSVNGSKRYHLALSRRGMLGLGAGAVVCLAWVFILGVLVGRGYQPEKQVPELATLMPASKNATAEMTHDKEKNKVIKAEDLDYYANLKEQPRSKGVTESSKTESSAEKKQQEPARELTAPAKAEPKKQAESEELKTIVPASPKATEAMTASKNQEKQEAPKQAAAPAKPKETVKPKETAKATTPAPAAKTAQVRPGMDAPVSTTKTAEADSADTQVYDYVYQIASLQDPNAALRFKNKVSKLGLKVEVTVVRSNSKVWHRVVVHFRGMPEETRGMKEKLEQVGVKKPLMTSKKPI